MFFSYYLENLKILIKFYRLYWILVNIFFSRVILKLNYNVVKIFD